jgi:integrase
MEAPTVEQNRWQRFISTLSSKSTIATYKTSIKKFLRHIYQNSFTNVEDAVERYFSEGRDYKEDVRSFFASIKEHPPKSVWTWLSAVRTLLIENGIDTELRFWRSLRRRTKGTRAVTEDTVPTKEELKKLFTHMGAKGKAFFQMLVSSGMRIGEAIQLQLEDIDLVEDKDLDKKPTTIHIRGEYTKSGNNRIAFMSKEATKAMRQWENIRGASLRTAIARSRGRKSKDDNRMFPFEIGNMYAVWNGALDKAQLNKVDKTTNRRKMHPHVLRKFFRSQMTTVIPLDVVEALMGHEGYLTTVYRKHSQEQLAEFYMRAEHTVLIFAETGDITKLKKEMEDTKKKADERAGDLQAIVNGLTAKNFDLEDEVGRLGSNMVALRSSILKYMEMEEHFYQLLGEYNTWDDKLKKERKQWSDLMRMQSKQVEAFRDEAEKLRKEKEELEKKQKKK